MDTGQMNYIGQLNTYAQQNGLGVQYVLVNTTGQAHQKMFTMRVEINGDLYPEGTGQNKQTAKHNAAKNALRCLENEEVAPSEMSSSSQGRILALTQANYICWLNEYSQKMQLTFVPQEKPKPSGSGMQMFLYACKYVCGDKEFPEATGKTKKEAKEAAAKIVYETLKGQETEQVTEENDTREENPETQNLSTSSDHFKLSSQADSESTKPNENYIGRLNEYCQKLKIAVDFILVKKEGPAHVPAFVYKASLSGKEYPEGSGRTAKDAKQRAAGLALHELHDEEFSSQISTPSSMSESPDDVSAMQKSSNDQASSDYIVFTDSPSVPQPSNVKPRRQLAINFQNSPVDNKKVQCKNQSSIKTTSVPNQSTKSRFLEDFTTISKIGKGGFGRVFKAKRTVEDRFFAVKIVKKTDKALREVNALCRLEHRHIVRYYTSWPDKNDYGDEASETCSTSSSGSGCDFLYIQMEFCEGDTLREWIDERNKHPNKYKERRKEAAEIIKEVLNAVKYIHSQKLFHRDLKPANIMFGHDGSVKVGDFGLVTKEGDDDKNLLERTNKAGTWSYMSPEQRQQKPYDKKVDIYAIGLIYFELVWSFGTQSEKHELWTNIRSNNFPEGFSEKFEFEHKLISQMLHENPKERPEAERLLSDMASPHIASTEHSVRRQNRTY